MKRKVLSVLLAVSMLTGLTACSSGGGGSAAPETKDNTTEATTAVAETAAEPAADAGGEEIVLDFPSWQATEPGFQEFWEAAIKEFESRNSNVKINMYQVPFDSYVDTLLRK